MRINRVTDLLFPLVKHQMRYMRQFILAPSTFGSLAPSSPWLCSRMAALADWSQVQTVAELGAGDGVLTRHLLRHLPAQAQLDAYEIQPELVQALSQRLGSDDRVTILPQSAEQLSRRYDVIFSCLPLLSLPPLVRLRILRQVRERLNPGGRFIQFQYSPLSERLLSRYFTWTRAWEVRNFPPAWVYDCTPQWRIAG